MESVAELNPKYLLYSDNFIDFDKKMLIKSSIKFMNISDYKNMLSICFLNKMSLLKVFFYKIFTVPVFD